MAESLVALAVEFGQRLLPLESNLLKHIRWYAQLRGARVNNRRVSRILAGKLHRFTTVSHALAFEGPGAEPVGEVLEGFQTSLAAHDLRTVVPAEQSIRLLVHFLGCDREGDYSVVDDAIVLKGPEVV